MRGSSVNLRINAYLLRSVLTSLYEALSVLWSVGPSIRPSVTLSSISMKNGLMYGLFNDFDSAW